MRGSHYYAGVYSQEVLTNQIKEKPMKKEDCTQSKISLHVSSFVVMEQKEATNV